MTVSSDTTDQAPNALLGNTLLIKHLTRRYSAFVLTAVQPFIGALFFLPLAVQSNWPTQLPIGVAGTIIYLGLVVSIGAYGLYNYSLTHLNASNSAGYTNLLPVFTLFFSMLLLGERLQWLQWGAIVLVFAGVYLSQKPTPVIPKGEPPSVTG